VKLAISPNLLETIGAAARRADPCECCGLIEGAVAEDGWRATAVHETRNLARDPARHFLVDPEVQFRLMRRLRGTERDVIGCFHSHPGGRAEPSAHDRESAAEDGFVWLIAAVKPNEEPAFAAFVFDAAQARFERLILSRSG
jgi:proteasome lid subunit RPN8/RPN11